MGVFIDTFIILNLTVFSVLTTGAYNYSMASNYNRNPRPAVVFAEDGKAQVVIRRESLEDLVHLDQDYNI